jgi:hypothetical protein
VRLIGVCLRVVDVELRDHRGMVNLCDQKGREVLMETRMPAKTRDERGWCNISLVNYALGSRRSCT